MVTTGGQGAADNTTGGSTASAGGKGVSVAPKKDSTKQLNGL